MGVRGPTTATVAIDGAKVRRLRQEAGMEVAELADKAGRSRSHIANIELGRKKRVTATTFRQLCDALEVPRDQRWRLFSDAEQGAPETAVA